MNTPRRLKEDLKSSDRLFFMEKKMKLLATVVAMYQVILSSSGLFFIILGLIHAEEVNNILVHDIMDENEMNENTVMPHSEGESINQMRFKFAQELASLTLMILYILSAIIIPYTCSSVGLLIGVIKNRPLAMFPWLVMNCISCLSVIALLTFVSFFSISITEKVEYWAVGCIIAVFDISNWFVIRRFYSYLIKTDKLASQLVESATVKIPFHYRKENIYLGNGGYKHHLTDPLVEEPTSITM